MKTLLTCIALALAFQVLAEDDPQLAAVKAADKARAEAAVDELRKLSMAIEQSPHAVVITDLNWIVEYVNDAFVATTGYAREELVGHPVLQLQSPAEVSTNDELVATLADVVVVVTVRTIVRILVVVSDGVSLAFSPATVIGVQPSSLPTSPSLPDWTESLLVDRKSVV
mgnify:CR=1 FL=1